MSILYCDKSAMKDILCRFQRLRDYHALKAQ